MSVTLEVFQSLRGWLKAQAEENMPDMSVTPETFQLFRGWLKDPAPANMPDMSVTPETSQDDRSPSNFVALLNMLDMSVTLDRSGASVAPYPMFVAFWKASAILLHVIVFPHCSMDCSFAAFSESPAR